MLWYPPAETKISLKEIFRSLFVGNDDLEGELRKFLRVDFCALANSGRSLLTLLLGVLKQRNSERDEVLIPGYTCYSVAASIAKAGLKIAVYDLDPGTLWPDLDSVRKHAGRKTAAIIVQHLFGIPTPINSMQEIAEDRGAFLIEDAAQGLGGKLQNRPLGVSGDFGLFSFGRGKPLPLGCGGALVGRDLNIIDQITLQGKKKGLAEILMTAATQVLSNPAIYGILEALPLGLGRTVFNPNFQVAPMPVFMMRLGKRSLAGIETMNAHRRKIAGIYTDIIGKSSFAVADDSLPVFSRYPLKVGMGDIPQDLLRMGVRRMYPKAIFEESNIRPYLAHPSSLTPQAANLAREIVTLPTHCRISQNLAAGLAGKVKVWCS